jgi:hypothetical protein
VGGLLHRQSHKSTRLAVGEDGDALALRLVRELADETEMGEALMAWTDLDTSTVDPELAAIHVVEFFVWWIQAGRHFYGDGGDEGLQEFARESVRALGGWRQARRVLREMDASTRILIEGKGSLV